MTMGTKIRMLRKQRRLTQLQIANALGFSRSIYSQYESDEREPSLKRLIAIANFFMVSLDFLCDINEDNLIDISSLDEEDKVLILSIIRRYNYLK